MEKHHTHQLPLPLSGKDSACFENYILGEKDSRNHLVVETLQSLVADQVQGHQALSPVRTPIFISGLEGSGKTHLLSALISEYRDRISAEGAYLDLTTAPLVPEMLGMALTAPLACIDGVDAWSGQPNLERALFSLVDEFKRKKKPLIVTAKNVPEACGFELPDLVSRLKSGVVFSLQIISDETKLRALKLRAKNRGLVIKDDALSFLMKRYARDTNSLFASLRELDKASIISKRKVTVPFIQQVLS